MIDIYASKNSSKSVSFASLGHLRYLSIMQFVDAVVGNSSRGITEATSFKKGTINIGDRQKGRIEPKSVISCEPTKGSIRDAFVKLYSEKFQNGLKDVKNPYGDGMASLKIKKYIKDFDLKDVIKKKFYDIDL